MDKDIQRGLDGLFAVCFKNWKAYNEIKIREIFGRYGHVVSVRFHGKHITGMVFVRYKDYDETKNCLEDLNKTNELNVRMAFIKPPVPDGPKQQSGSFKIPFNNSITGNQSSLIKNGPRKQVQHNLMQKDMKKSSVQQKSETHHTENGNCEEPRQSGEQSSIKSEVPEHEEPLNGEKINGHSKGGSDDTDGKGSPEREIAVNKTNAEYPGNEYDLKNRDIRNQISQKSHASNDDIDDGPPPLVGFEDMPDLVVERPKVYAKDVIIANFPPSFDLHDIMRLAKKFALNPIQISPIEMTGIKYNIPFCHLWVKDEYEAEIAESELQGFNLAGNTLLVARAEKLLNSFKQPMNV